jgi:hypothetical protein
MNARVKLVDAIINFGGSRAEADEVVRRLERRWLSGRADSLGSGAGIGVEEGTTKETSRT